MHYDIAAGMDSATLNTVVSQVYKALYPNLLRNTLNVQQIGIASITFDINATPIIILAQGQEVDEAFSAILNEGHHEELTQLDAVAQQELLTLAKAASFSIKLPGLALSIHYTNSAPTNFAANFTGAVNIQTSSANSQNALTVQILSGTIGIPSDPGLADILNKIFVPLLTSYLNKNILDFIKIPALQFKSLLVSMPLPVVQNGYVTAYSALGAVQPDIPATNSWPSHCFYAALDTQVLQAAAGLFFPLGPSADFSWKIISGKVRAQVLAPAGIVINHDGSLTATMTAQALAQLTLHTPWPFSDYHFGPEAHATVTATVAPTVRNGEVVLAFKNSSTPSFSFSWGSIPTWVYPFLWPLLTTLELALNAVVGPLVRDAINNLPPIDVYTIPAITLNLGGSTIHINIAEARTVNMDNNVVVCAQVVIS